MSDIQILNQIKKDLEDALVLKQEREKHIAQLEAQVEELRGLCLEAAPYLGNSDPDLYERLCTAAGEGGER